MGFGPTNKSVAYRSAAVPPSHLPHDLVPPPSGSPATSAAGCAQQFTLAPRLRDGDGPLVQKIQEQRCGSRHGPRVIGVALPKRTGHERTREREVDVGDDAIGGVGLRAERGDEMGVESHCAGMWRGGLTVGRAGAPPTAAAPRATSHALPCSQRSRPNERQTRRCRPRRLCRRSYNRDNVAPPKRHERNPIALELR